MRRALIFLAASFFVVTLGAAALDSAAGVAAAATRGADDDPQAPSPPQAVSPADPTTVPPAAGRWVCPRCGAECPGPVWRQKGQLGRPQLGPGREEGRVGKPGRWGRDGGRRDRDGMDIGRDPRGRGRADFAGAGPRAGVAADMMLRHAAALELTQDQIDKLEGLAAETKKKLIDLRAEMEKSRLDMRSLLRSESEDLAQVKKQMGALSKARADMQEARITHLFEARRVLTAEQKKMVKERFPRLGRTID